MKNNAIKKFYEKFHEDKITNPVTEFMQHERCTFLRSILKNAKGEVLIIGCGSEDEMSILNDKCNGIGIDISENAIKKSKEKYPKYTYLIADARNLPFQDGRFDFVICSEVIEHIPQNEKVISEIKRVLKNSGILILTTPNWINWYGFARKTAEILYKRPFTADNQPIDNWSTSWELRKKLFRNGFSITLFRGLWYFPPTGKGARQIPWRITLPIIKLLYPFELLSRSIFPWFGHMLVFKAEKMNL